MDSETSTWRFTNRTSFQAKNAMEVYSKAMELDPNSDEAKNGEPGLLNPPLEIDFSSSETGFQVIADLGLRISSTCLLVNLLIKTQD